MHGKHAPITQGGKAEHDGETLGSVRRDLARKRARRGNLARQRAGRGSTPRASVDGILKTIVHGIETIRCSRKPDREHEGGYGTEDETA